MRVPVTRVDVGTVVIATNGRRLEVLERGTWLPASGGEAWVQLRLRSLDDGAMSLAGYEPSQEVQVDPATMPAA
jgi:hypothetical protein